MACTPVHQRYLLPTSAIFTLYASVTARSFFVLYDVANHQSSTTTVINVFRYGEGATPLPTTYGSNSHASVDGYGGTWRWDDAIAKERAGGFPSGLKNLTNYLGAKIVRNHMLMKVTTPLPTTPPAVLGRHNALLE